jgi:SAM-dependent methyltransferase
MRDRKYQNNRNSRPRSFQKSEDTSKRDTSWQSVAGTYNKSVGEQGHYFHQTVIMPKAATLLGMTDHSSLLDLACGQGVLSRNIPKGATYYGFDLAKDLIQYAKNQSYSFKLNFDVADITAPLQLDKNDFTHAAIILALQNVENMQGAIQNAAKHLVSGGKFLIVLNHPCFRIPRQSSWEIDENNKTQYRRINRYQSALKIPINMNPGSQSGTKLTWSFHNPISAYSDALFANGFLIEKIEEWVSEKNSVGKAAKMENFAREEFPMFMAILAVKK